MEVMALFWSQWELSCSELGEFPGSNVSLEAKEYEDVVAMENGYKAECRSAATLDSRELSTMMGSRLNIC